MVLELEMVKLHPSGGNNCSVESILIGIGLSGGLMVFFVCSAKKVWGGRRFAVVICTPRSLNFCSCFIPFLCFMFFVAQFDFLIF